MKTAIDFYARGKQKEASADDYDRKSFYIKSRFICPECGETVHLTGSKYSNHFSHSKKTDISAECDRRIEGESTESVYERIGLPIYIRKDINNNFFLYLGFKALPASIMENAEREHISVKIAGERIYSVNRERFSTENTSFIQIDYVPMSEQKYCISFEPANKAYMITKHWADFADGFSFQGALFSVTEHGGKKIRHGDSISSDLEYYWVRRQPQLPGSVPGIKMILVGKLMCQSGHYFVFQGKFSSDISNGQFNELTTYLREYLRVHLLEKQPEFVPVWPPVIRREEGYLVSSRVKNVYGHIVSGNDIPKIYFYQGIMAIPTELFACDYVVNIPMIDDNILVNIDRKYVSSGTYLTRGELRIEEYMNEIYEISGQEIILLDETTVERTQNTLLFECKRKAEFVLVRITGQIEKVEGIGQYKFERLNTGDCIYILHNRNLTYLVTISLTESNKEKKHVGEENNVNLLIRKYQNSIKVQVPNKIKVQLIQMLKYGDKLHKEIEQVLLENKIPVPMIRILEDMIDGRS